jgi:urease accessory protein
MSTEAALYRLLTWLSPAYPVGAYSYSHGLEWAVEIGAVRDRDGLVAWLATLLRHGGGWSDAVLLARGHEAAGVPKAWQELRRLAHALAPTAELALETRAQGEAFARASLASWPDADGRLAVLLAGEPPPTYPLAVAAVAACHGIPLGLLLPAYLQAFAANLVSAAVRLVPLGQTDGQRTIAALEPIGAEVAIAAAACILDELGTATLAVDLCSIHHETQHTRLFRS